MSVIRRFEPSYWQVDFNVASAASLVSASANELLLTVAFRTTNDLTGLKWMSVDTVDHPLCRYATDVDYSTTVLDFDFLSTNVRAPNAVSGPTLAVTHVDGTVQYVRISNYLSSGIPTNGHYRLDFAIVGGGWDGTEHIDWSSVDNLLLSVMHDSYDPTNPAAPIAETIGTIHITNVTVSGPALNLGTPELTPHRLRMTDGYDDSYFMTPTRLVAGMYQLGYRDWYTIYFGISHHHNVEWNTAEARFQVNPAVAAVNPPARAWFDSLFIELAASGFTKVVLSQSYEIVGYQMRDEWAQRDASGAFGETGWTPPSKLISPCNTDALNYLVAVMSYFVGRAQAADLTVHIQTGEPWWWDNSFSTRAPCFYDDTTVATYHTETGVDPPTPRITSIDAPLDDTQTGFLAWLNGKLGASTLYIRDQVKAAYPDVLAAILFFTPQIYGTPVMTAVNLPTASWHEPAWDILQVEDYDWVTAGEWDLHASTWTTAFVTLGYQPAQVHFFAGFVLNAVDAAVQWPLISRAIVDGIDHGVAEVWVWARPQVFRDGYVYTTARPVPVTSTAVTAYRYITADMLTGSPLAELPLKCQNFSQQLSGVGSMTATLPLGSLPPSLDWRAATRERRTTVNILRNDQVVWGGPIMKNRPTDDGRSAEITAETWEGYLDRRRIKTTLTFTDTDVYQIVRSILNALQRDVLGGNARMAVEAGMGGYIQTITYPASARNKALDAITKLSQVAPYFEFYVAVDRDRATGVFTPTLVLQRTTAHTDELPVVAEFPGNARSYDYPSDGSNAANAITGVGKGDGDAQLMVEVTDEAGELASGYPIYEDELQAKDEDNLERLTALTETELVARLVDYVVPTVELDGDSIPQFGSYPIGINCLLRATSLYHPPSATGAPGLVVTRRVTGWTVTPAAAGQQEKVQLALATGAGKVVPAMDARRFPRWLAALERRVRTMELAR